MQKIRSQNTSCKRRCSKVKPIYLLCIVLTFKIQEKWTWNSWIGQLTVIFKQASTKEITEKWKNKCDGILENISNYSIRLWEEKGKQIYNGGSRKKSSLVIPQWRQGPCFPMSPPFSICLSIPEFRRKEERENQVELFRFSSQKWIEDILPSFCDYVWINSGVK